MKFVFFLKSRLIFINFMNTGACISESCIKRCYNVKILAYYFYVRTKIPLDFHIKRCYNVKILAYYFYVRTKIPLDFHIKRCYNVKILAYYFYMRTKIPLDFHICIRVPLKTNRVSPRFFT